MKHLLKSSFIVLTLTLAGLSAEATPAVGEKSVFAVNITQGSQTADGTMTLELTAFDAATDSWTMVTTTAFNGQEQRETKSTKTSDLISDAMIDHLLANCVASGGALDTVTSPAGSLPACAMPINDESSTGTLWVSKVPFGYSKWTTRRSDGMVVSGLLQSFTPAAPAK